LGRVLRNLALLEPKASSSRATTFGESREKLEAAKAGYSGLVGKRARRGTANCMVTLGRLKEDVGVSGHLRRGDMHALLVPSAPFAGVGVAFRG